jgi:Tol biopolymer transport system component
MAPDTEPLYNHIAFIGNDNNLWLVTPDGERLRQLTRDGQGYRWPTWSPDGRYLAFISSAGSLLYVSPTTTGSPLALFDSQNSPPFYLYWVPNSRSITFLTQEEDSLAMRRADIDRPGEDQVLGAGSPFYWAWSPASDKLLMHVGGARAFSPEAHLSILHNEQNAERIELKLAPGRFQAPLWSADGRYTYYIAWDGQRQESIYRMDAENLQTERLTSLSGFGYMVLSPAGDRLAYLEIIRSGQAPFGPAYLIKTDGTARRKLTDEPVGSMYWSPDSKKLALLTMARRNEGPTAKIDGRASPLRQALLLRWWIYDVETEKLTPLLSFAPTLQFLQTLPYFDQYHLSLTFWSPDSRYLVVTEEEEEGDDGSVWVIDTTGAEEDRQVGQGGMAVWSWK